MMEFSEHIKTPKIENVVIEEQGKTKITGTACLTGHHLILYSHNGENKEVWFLHRNIDAVEKKFTLEKNILIVKCKDFKQYIFTIPNQEEAVNVCNSIEALSHVASPALHYPFFYRCKFKFTENGYDLLSTEQEFEAISKFSNEWRVSSINERFDVCKSYPPKVIVPKHIDDEILRKSAQFRHGQRFPVLSYCHGNGRALLRSSQPLVGPSNKRCKEDEKLVNAFLGINHRGYIIDTRSYQAAAQARGKGGGFETEFCYPRWRKVHHALLKYNVQQESLIRIVEACQDQSSNSDKWQSKLESSNWLSNVKDLLSCACLVAQCIDKEGASVLVHGSEGVDSTLQVTALSQVIIDPYCRTIRGFISLIEKDWVQAGHPFMGRCFHSAHTNQKMSSEGPLFTVFLDCVYQILQQFPLSFEFNDKLLLEVNQHAYASQFGTFLCNNEYERKKINVHTKTTSLWSYILSDEVLSKFYNPIYQEQHGAVWPSVAPQSLTIWESLFLPHLDSSVEKEKVVRDALSEIEQLEDELSKLKKDVVALEKLSLDIDNAKDT